MFTYTKCIWFLVKFILYLIQKSSGTYGHRCRVYAVRTIKRRIKKKCLYNVNYLINTWYLYLYTQFMDMYIFIDVLQIIIILLFSFIW